uniref:Uncharacterized protein n=1 Tax=Macrostomum lignano TaxID=282301 RepID=A0A1I8HTV2_9PLAT
MGDHNIQGFDKVSTCSSGSGQPGDVL